MGLFRHLRAMHDETLAKTKVSVKEAVKLFNSLKFDVFKEDCRMKHYNGISILNPALREWENIVEDVCTRYMLDSSVKKRLLYNKGSWVKRSVETSNYEFNVVRPGVFYRCKMMAVKIDDKFDCCFLSYRLSFKMSATAIQDPLVMEFCALMKFPPPPQEMNNLDESQRDNINELLEFQLCEKFARQIQTLAEAEPLDAPAEPPAEPPFSIAG